MLYGLILNICISMGHFDDCMSVVVSDQIPSMTECKTQAQPRMAKFMEENYPEWTVVKYTCARGDEIRIYMDEDRV